MGSITNNEKVMAAIIQWIETTSRYSVFFQKKIEYGWSSTKFFEFYSSSGYLLGPAYRSYGCTVGQDVVESVCQTEQKMRKFTSDHCSKKMGFFGNFSQHRGGPSQNFCYSNHGPKNPIKTQSPKNFQLDPKKIVNNGQNSQKGEVGVPLFGNNSQIIPYFFLKGVPYLYTLPLIFLSCFSSSLWLFH